MEELGCILLDAVRSGNGSLIIAALLCLVVFMVRSFVAPRVAFFSSDVGGASLTFLMGFSGAIMTAVASGSALSLSLVGNAFSISLTAMGGYAAIKKLLMPYAVRFLATMGVGFSLDTMTKALQASEPKPDLQKR